MASHPFDALSHLRQLDRSQLDSLLNDARPPCISIYLPTHRAGPQTRENHIRFKALLQQAIKQLSSADKKQAQRHLQRASPLVEEGDFWQHQLEALAFFLDEERLDLVRLPRPVPREIVAVADSFHVKPLLRAMQQVDRYQLLALTQKSVALYEGDRDHLDLVPLRPGVPRSLLEALGEEITGGELNVAPYGGIGIRGMFHGHHDNRDERDIDLERYFRAIDKAIYDHHGHGHEMPLFLAADVDYHDRFRKVSHHPRLQPEGVRLNPAAAEITPERLREEMNGILIPHMHRRTRDLIEQYGAAKARGLGADDPRLIASAATQGRIATLMTDAERRVGGRVEPNGAVEYAPESDPSIDDVLDDLAELTLRNGGRVLVVPPEVHPSASGVAAVFRY